MKWIFALSEPIPEWSEGKNYELMATVAVQSAKERAPGLEPILLWNGTNHTDFTRSMENLGVQVVFHRLSFQDAVNVARGRSDIWKQIAKGAMLRLDIPMIFESSNEKILYTDVDVMFLDDPSKYQYDCELFAFSSEFDYDDFERINTGIMVLNLQDARQRFTDFLLWTVKNLEWIPDFDQGAIRTYFDGRWDRLDQRMNWKPYWNTHTDPIIVHFHGPKPTNFNCILLAPNFSIDDEKIYAQLYKMAPAGYQHYLKRWISFAHNYFGFRD
jgi:lipopolysaccharide biosynthesis glycosyltransferase